MKWHEYFSVSNVYLALHRQWDIEIDFSVSEGTFFPLYLPEAFPVGALSSLHVILTQAANHISTFLSVGLRVRTESTSQSGTPGHNLGQKRPFSGINIDSGKERHVFFPGISVKMYTLSCCWPLSPLCGARIPVMKVTWGTRTNPRKTQSLMTSHKFLNPHVSEVRLISPLNSKLQPPCHIIIIFT